MNQNEQLLKWLKNETEHDQEHNRCVPDFSCCRPELRADQYIIENFIAAFLNDNFEVVENMTLIFIERRLISQDQVVFIITDPIN